MRGAAAQPQPLPDRQQRRAVELVATASIELTPRDKLAGAALAELFAPGTTVFVSHPGSAGYGDIVDACTRLRRAGFEPVPHIAARRLDGVEAAVDFLRRATDEAGVTDALVIGGDPSWPAGPFRDALSLIKSGLIECHGLDRVRFAGYPEGHPYISAGAIDAALYLKLAEARQRGLDVSLVTQFAFEAGPIARWLDRLHARGIDCPVRIGIAGPASAVTLAKFAVRCGIGNSLRALARGHTAFARVLTETTPDALIDELVAGEPASGAIAGLHLFTFGGVGHTAAWRQHKLA